jgi:hypothetical protein
MTSAQENAARLNDVMAERREKAEQRAEAARTELKEKAAMRRERANRG